MTSKAGGKIVQMLSPENYIRQRARSLPLHECLVNTGWEDSHMVNVIISRKHSNGNITACLYLVDLFCQGVKDTTWFFNIPSFEYQDIIDDIRDQMDIEYIKYELVHNIIFAAIEFAEEYDFYPHKDFSSVTRFMLEEDTDDIELIEIECGIEGKPAYMRTPGHSDREAAAIISKLEKNAGPGNYHIFDELDEDEIEDYGEDSPDSHDEFSKMTTGEKKRIIGPLIDRYESLSENETKTLTDVSLSLFEDLCDPDNVKRYLDEITSELKTKILPYDVIPDELVGKGQEIIPGTTELKELFVEIYRFTGKKPSKARKLLKKSKKKYGDLPALAFLELRFFYPADDERFREKLEFYSSRYGDYPLINLLRLSENIPDASPEKLSCGRDIKSLFPGRKALHMIEMLEYLKYYIISSMTERNPHKLKAMQLALMKTDILETDDVIGLLTTLSLSKFGFIMDYMGKTLFD